ncbi:MAG: AbrB/MazE/SpoVT family DNA-binding domain-containing protein [Bryobacteraceae bacterium]|jgi:bifunctional DNA-binding transcriptional regulator/antitoxin component of YhaV-PrlF toxin-antitoxin module
MKTVIVKVDGSGRVLLPAKFRKELDLRRGSELIMRLGKESLLLKTRAQAIREAQDHFSRLRRKGELWSEELIKDRRREARRERAS